MQVRYHPPRSSCYILFLDNFSDLKDKLERKNVELETAQQKLIDAADEEKTIAEERLRSSYTERKPRQRRDSDEEISPRGNCQIKPKLF